MTAHRRQREGVRPDVEQVLGRLKDFQRATVDHVFSLMYLDPDPAHRFLVADEVGLGKTMIARGVIARALDHLWDRVDRIDVVYICSNADIARQNVNRLNVAGHRETALATRLTLLPSELRRLSEQKVNFVSFTPGTSFDLRSSMGQWQERVLLYFLLRDVWQFRRTAAPLNVLRGYASVELFRCEVDAFERQATERIDPGLAAAFIEALAVRERRHAAAGQEGLAARFAQACTAYARSNANPSREEASSRSRLIAELRGLLAATCIRSLEPDLIILDEFQRFKHLLQGEADGAKLARELFDYEHADGRARTLLLSATPYKMYTTADEAGEEDHYADFVATLRFLHDNDVGATSRVSGLLKELRRALMTGALDLERVSALRREIERALRRVVVRTERLAVTEDRNGMLREVVAADGVRLESRDARAYCAVQRVGEELEQSDAVEYWKAAPYLLSMMDGYQLKTRLAARLEADGVGGVAGLVRSAIRDDRQITLPADAIEEQRPLDVPHPRMRWLLRDMVDRGAWQLLWVPPSMPYHALGGAFASPELQGFTKRLVFSAWRVVPKSIATLVSYEAERRMLAPLRHEGETRTAQLERTRGLLRFSESRGRLTGMPTLALCYPSISLARAGDPLTLAGEGGDVPSYAEVRERCTSRLAPALERLTAGAETAGPADEAWYWAAPLLLDLAAAHDETTGWLTEPNLAERWLGAADPEAAGEDEDRGWREHVARLQELARVGPAGFGPPPADLAQVVADLALCAPAVCALRALARGENAHALVARVELRMAAGSIGHGFRGLFNLPEVISLVRGGAPEEAYWRATLEYAAAGCLQAVLDEYVHVLRESEGLMDAEVSELAPRVASRMRDALGARTTRLQVDHFTVAGNHRVTLESRTLRARFAMRFGDRESTDGEEAGRSETVRTAFNSPFWPFVLASTSVGQEGLDFHHYCHAVVHWNLPSNPVDLEQREGRVHRYKGHAVRRNVASQHAHSIEGGAADPWELLFAAARDARAEGSTDLVPYWLYPIPGGAAIERHVPNLPLSRDAQRHDRLRRALAVYRMAFGQPRQDELVAYLDAAEMGADPRVAEALTIDLAPQSAGMQTSRPGPAQLRDPA